MDRLTAARALAVASLGAGVALLAASALMGRAHLFFVLIFPVVTGEGVVFALGAVLTMVGILAAFLFLAPLAIQGPEMRPPPTAPSPSVPQPPDTPPNTPPSFGMPAEGGARWGGVVFIGPVPIVLGSGPGATRLMLVAAVVMALLLLVFALGALMR
jgi:uncharacterized membrane protein